MRMCDTYIRTHTSCDFEYFFLLLLLFIVNVIVPIDFLCTYLNTQIYIFTYVVFSSYTYIYSHEDDYSFLFLKNITSENKK